MAIVWILEDDLESADLIRELILAELPDAEIEVFENPCSALMKLSSPDIILFDVGAIGDNGGTMAERLAERLVADHPNALTLLYSCCACWAEDIAAQFPTTILLPTWGDGEFHGEMWERIKVHMMGRNDG